MLIGFHDNRNVLIASKFCVQVLQEEMGVMKCHNLKPGGDKILVTRQNRKGEPSTHKGRRQTHRR